MRALRNAFSLFTVLPVGTPHVRREDAGLSMLLAPVTGVVLGLAGAAVLIFARGLYDQYTGGPISAALAIGAVALGSRGLHLDGLADTADGLGSRRPDALAIMHRGDVGPFGVVAVVFVLLLDVAALTATVPRGRGTVSLVTAVVTGRLAATLACTRATPAARAEGLGAFVAGTVSRAGAALATLLVVAGAAYYGWHDDFGGRTGALRGGGAVVFGLAVAHVLRAHAVRRLGGITGDVLGALVEVATCGALLVLAISAQAVYA